MDHATIALPVAGLLAKKALEAAGGKAGEGAWAALGRIANAVRSRFRSDPDVTETLERLEARPTRSGSSLIVAVNALTLKRLPLPKAEQQDRPQWSHLSSSAAGHRIAVS
jgi:hypothetical protein